MDPSAHKGHLAEHRRPCQRPRRRPRVSQGHSEKKNVSGAWMHSSKQECCCEAKQLQLLLDALYGLTTDGQPRCRRHQPVVHGMGCAPLSASRIGPSRGGRANSWDQLFETRSACCADKAAWNPEGRQAASLTRRKSSSLQSVHDFDFGPF